MGAVNDNTGTNELTGTAQVKLGCAATLLFASFRVNAWNESSVSPGVTPGGVRVGEHRVCVCVCVCMCKPDFSSFGAVHLL